MALYWQRNIPLWVQGCDTSRNMAVTTWLKAILIISCAVVKTAVSTSDIPPSAVATSLQPTAASQFLMNAITVAPAAVNQTTVTFSTPIGPSSIFSISSSSTSTISPSQTSQDIIVLMDSTVLIDSPMRSTLLPSSSFSSATPTLPIPATTMLSLLETTQMPEIMLSSPVLMATVELPDTASVFHESSTYVTMESSVVSFPVSSGLSPTPTASSGVPVLMTSSTYDMMSTVTHIYAPPSTSTLPDTSVSVPPPTPSSTDFLPTSFISTTPLLPSSSVPSTPMPSGEPSLPSTPMASDTVIVLPSATMPPMTSSPQTPVQSQPSPSPSLSSVPSSSSAVFLTPTPTMNPLTSHPTPGPAEGGLLTTVQWIGIAVAVTAAFIILCVVVWWLIRERKSGSKHKPTYTKENVTVDLSRSTSNDPKDVWRNSLLLESMSTRIVVPQEDDEDEMLQSIENYGFEGISDEEEHTSSSPKEVPLTKV